MTSCQGLVHKLIDRHLDTTKCFQRQSKALIGVVTKSVRCMSINHILCLMIVKTIETFPEMKEYADAWPVIELIKQCLKYTSVRRRRQDERAAFGKWRDGKV